MAFVLVPHLDPTHESLMVDLLARQTTMPVGEARDGVRVERNHVYVIPPNADLTIEHRVLHVAPPPARRGSRTAIDVFLQSLAADQGAHAIGIILSGTGSHGAIGIQEIRAAGGMTIAQAPESAEHDQMPRSAIATGLVDHVLAPEEMPKALLRQAMEPSAPRADVGPEALAQIVSLLRTHAKRDFGGYRTSMLMRRVRRRMGVCHVEPPRVRLLDLRASRSVFEHDSLVSSSAFASLGSTPPRNSSDLAGGGDPRAWNEERRCRGQLHENDLTRSSVPGGLVRLSATAGACPRQMLSSRAVSTRRA